MSAPPPGDLAVLRTPTAVALLASPIPARVAYVTRGGEPRVVPVWFHWDGTEIVFAAFPGAPKLAHVRTGDRLALTVDTEAYPYQALQVRGPVTVAAAGGIVPEYAAAAVRYLGEAEAKTFLDRLTPPPAMTRIALRPDWARMMDMRAEAADGEGAAAEG